MGIPTRTEPCTEGPNRLALWFKGGPADGRYIFAYRVTPLIRMTLHNGATVSYRMTNRCMAGAIVYVCTP